MIPTTSAAVKTRFIHYLHGSSLSKPIILVALSILIWWPALAQPPVPGGDCGRTTLYFSSATNVSTTIPELSGTTQGSGTWEAWVKKENWGSYNQDEKLFSNDYDYPSESAFYISLHSAPTVGFHFRTGNSGGSYVSNNSTFGFSANSWHHFAATWSESGGTVTTTIYIDGAAAGSITSTSTFDLGSSFYIGGKDGMYKFSNGEMAEVRVWNVARTEQEIADNRFNLLNGDESGLVGYWPLDETPGSTTATNLVSGGSNGTVVNLNASTDWKNFPVAISADAVISKGATYDFGTQLTNESSDVQVFTITNHGASSIDLSANPISALAGDNADEFELDLTAIATSLAAGASTTFSITFTPTTEGTKTALFSFANVSGCSDPYSFTITGISSTLAASINVDANVSIYGDSDGALTAAVSGGSTPYTYLWNNSQETATISGLSAGEYSVLVTDAIGASVEVAATITQPEELAASIEVVSNVTTIDGSDGELTASATGGVEPFTYLWNNSETTATISGLAAGEYTVTVTDDNGATSEASVTVTEPGSPSSEEFNGATMPGSYEVASDYPMIAFNDNLYVILEDGSNGIYGALYSYNGTAFTQVTLPDGLEVASAFDMKVYDGDLYLVLDGGSGGLYQYDGASFTQVTLPENHSMVSNYEMEVYNNKLYVVLADGSSGIYGALYEYEGSAFSAVGLPEGYKMASERPMIAFNDNLYVILEDGSNGIYGALYYYNGSSFTSVPLPGELEVASEYNMKVFSGDLYLVLDGGSVGLYQYDGASFTQVTLPENHSLASNYEMEVYDDNLYVILEDGSSGIYGALYQYDGSELLAIGFPEGYGMDEGFGMEVYLNKLYMVLEGSGGEVLYSLQNLLDVQYGGDGFSESSSNDGSVTGSITITLTGDTFQDDDEDGLLDVGSQVVINNIPEGLSPVLTITSTNAAELTLTGNASSHQATNLVSDITFEFANSAFSDLAASEILNGTGPASSDLGVTFTDNPSIAYSGEGFTETEANDGSVEGSIIITLDGDTYRDDNGDGLLDINTEVVVNNIPDGLSPVLSITTNQKLGDVWEAKSQLNSGYNDMAYGNGIYVAVRSSTHNGQNVIGTSTNGYDWDETEFATSIGWIEVIFAEGQFVAIGSDGGTVKVLTSNDGLDWTIQTTPTTFGSGLGIVYGNGLYVVVGSSGEDRVMTSPDGIAWTVAANGLESSWCDVAYGNGMFVAVATELELGKQVMTSTDGENWTFQNGTSDGYWVDMTFGAGLFVAVSDYDYNKMMTSSDGVNWSSAETPSSNNYLSRVTYGGGRFLVSEYDGMKLIKSEDGINWTEQALTNPIYRTLYAEGQFVAIPKNPGYITVSQQLSEAKLELSGQATSHQQIHDIADITFAFTDAAFTNSLAANVLNANGPASSGLGLAFTDNPAIIYSGDGFTETAANNGIVGGSVVITLEGDIFEESLTIGNGVSVQNIPVGVSPQLTRNNDTQATLTLSGSATNHQAADNIADITFEFTDAAFANTTVAAVFNAAGPASSDLGISFTDNLENDHCDSPQSLTVYLPGEGTPTEGTTLNAGITGEPNPCAETLDFKDVWYSFNSGESGQVVITAELGTAIAVSGAVYTSCGEILQVDNLPACANNVDEPVFIALLPNTDFLLQVWNTEEDAGTFSVLLEKNLPPTIATIEDKEVDEETEIQFTVTAEDEFLPNGEIEYYLDSEFTDLGMSINFETGQFSWTPSEAQDGAYAVTALAVDYYDFEGNVNSANATFTLTVNDVNEAPVLAAIENQTVEADAVLEFSASATDADLPANTLTYSLDAASLEKGMSINSSTGAFSWEPSSTDFGMTSEITLSVSDGELADEETFSIEVEKGSQTITFSELEDRTYSEEPFEVTATASSTLVVSYSSSDEMVATISGTTLTIVGAGTATITASQSGNTNFEEASDVAQTLTIEPTEITLTADAKSKVYGEANPTLTFEITSGSLLDGDQITGALNRITGENAGTYAILQNTLTAGANYGITFETADFTIEKKPLTATADDKSKTYGEENPELTISYDGFIDGEDATDITAPAIATEADANSDAGDYEIGLTGGSADNYELTLVDGTLTIEPKAITLTADAKSKVYGEANPTLTFEITSGSLLDGDQITGALSRIAGENAGTYAILQNTLTAGTNYGITFETADFTIEKKSLTATADDKSKTYGEENPELTIGYDGFIDGEDATDITAPATATDADANSDAGDYEIGLTGGSADNYGLTLVDGTLTISKAAQILIFASLEPKIFGNAPFSLTATGGASGNTVTYTSSNTAVATILGNTVTIIGAGTTTITASHVGNDNYTAAPSVEQILTVNKASQMITFGTIGDKTYGDAAFDLTAVASSGLEVSFEIEKGPASITGSTITVTGVGEVSIQATQAGNATYNAATPVSRTFTSAKAILIVTADDKMRIYNTSNPEFTLSYGSFVNEDTEAVLDELPTISTEAGSDSNAGEYSIAVSGGSDDLYAFEYIPGTLSINKATASIGLSDLVQSTNGTMKSPTVTTSPEGLNFIITYEGDETPIEAGRYFFTVAIDEINYEGSVSDTLIVEAQENVLGASDWASLKVYPNPVKTYLKISSKESLNIEVVDTQGRSLLYGSSDEWINVEGLESGLYFVKVYLPTGDYRLIKMVKAEN